MKVIYHRKTNLLLVVEMSIFRKHMFRELSIIKDNENGTWFTKGKYLNNDDCTLIGRY